MMDARRVIVWLYAGLFVAVGIVAGALFFRTYQEYAQLQRLEAEGRQRLARLEQRLQDQQRELDRMRSDPAYVEKIIRRQLRYARPSEQIFRFEEGRRTDSNFAPGR